MKLIPILMLSVVLSTANFVGFSQTVQREYVRYVEHIQQASTFQNQSMPPKEQRVSSSSGDIILIYDDALPDSIKVALTAAKELWEAKLPTRQPIYISVAFEPLDDDIAMVADVADYSSSGLVGCPSALASQINNIPCGSIEFPDGYVFFNSNIDWNCNFSDRYASEYNLPTIALRGIARCLGFGASVTYIEQDGFQFYFGYPLYFDKLLYNNGARLSDIPQKSREMADFVTSDNVYLKTGSHNYKIYAPERYINSVSLCYLDGGSSLMSYSLGQGNVALGIDDATVDILRAIGWDLPLLGFRIQCSDISDTGIGSAYSSHTFSLSKGNENVSNYSWTFSLKDNTGGYVKISGGTSEEFTIDKISSPENYFVNINGDLEGRIECDYTVGGQQYSAEPFMLSLELKPTILSIDNLTIERNEEEFTFSLAFDVRYAGADFVTFEIEEEYNTMVPNYRVYEPYIAHVNTGAITFLYYSWVYVTVSNKYGSTTETMEFAPNYTPGDGDGGTTGDDLLTEPGNVKSIQLYELDGTIVFVGSQAEFSTFWIAPGIYVIKLIYDNGYTQSIKKIVK